LCTFQKPLQDPVVACALGKLYNKDAIIEYLLNKNAYGDGDIICSHISSMKDIKPLKLTANPAFKETNEASIAHFDQGMVSRFVCPITLKEMNGKLKFVYLNTCGCVFSEQGLKEVPSSACIQCGKPFKQENVITLNPSPTEQEKLKIALEERKTKAKEKKEKKKNKVLTKQDSNESVIAESSSSTVPNNKRKRENNSEEDSKQSSSKKPLIKSEVSVAASSSSSVSSGVGGNSVTAVVNQKVQEHLVNTSSKTKQSKAIQSIYSKKKDDSVTESYLVRGTFNRYA
jgi:hypothetical protein